MSLMPPNRHKNSQLSEAHGFTTSSSSTDGPIEREPVC